MLETVPFIDAIKQITNNREIDVRSLIVGENQLVKNCYEMLENEFRVIVAPSAL